MAIDLQKLEQKFDALINDSNFVTDFEQWLEARRPRQHDAKLPVSGEVCDNCGDGKPLICAKCYETESNFRESY